MSIQKIKGRIIKYFIIFMFFVLVILGVKDLFFTGQTKVDIKRGNITEFTTEEKIEDFETMYNILKENYPYFEVEKRIYGYDWLGKKEDFKKIISNTKNNSEFYNAMYDILISIQNGHTHIVDPNFYKELRDVYNNGAGMPSWKDIILNDKVNERYNYWENTITYSAKYLPIYFKYIEGKYIVYYNLNPKEDELKKNQIQIGWILNKINDVPVEKYILGMISTNKLSYDYKRKKPIIKDLVVQSQGNCIFKLTFQNLEGKTIEKEVKSLDYISYNNPLLNEKENFSTRIIEDGKIAYIKFKSFDYRLIEENSEGIYQFFHKIKDYPYLIIDIRGNPGGSSSYWQENIISPLTKTTLSMEYIIGFRDGEFINRNLEDIVHWGNVNILNTLPSGKNYPPEIYNSFHSFINNPISVEPKIYTGFKGKIYLLVDDGVYSAAEGFAAFAKETGWATLVGSTTGGDGLGFDPAYTALPNSGLIVRFPIGMGFNPDGTANEETHTSPDIYIEQNTMDFIKMTESFSLKNFDYYEVVDKYDTVLKNLISMIK